MMKTSLKEWEPGVKVMNDLSAIPIMGVEFALVLNQLVR